MSAYSDAQEAAKLYDYGPDGVEFVVLSDAEFVSRFLAFVDLCAHGEKDTDSEVELYLPRGIYERLAALAIKGLTQPNAKREGGKA